MPYFAISETMDKIDVCVGRANVVKDVDYHDFLGTRRVWKIREIDVFEARKLLGELQSDKTEVELDYLFEKLVRVVSMPLSYTNF